MKYLLTFIITWLIAAIVFPIAHERDIARQCREQGNSGKAAWTVHFTCKNQ